ncbi:MAG: AAA family ATPase, partial [Bacteroidales bacterium]|nr:AAA family ATPase [Bacteroidales bacterium]
MRIDKIEICNIASIEGEQQIDFTQEPLKSAGLFAITGKTGAGKSTVLDAVCLALYNEAPRL